MVVAAGGDPVSGKAVFKTAGCTGCHTLVAAGSTGTVGPNLDQRKPTYDTVVARVSSGRGVMPSFSGTLSAQQIADVAAFVSQATGGSPPVVSPAPASGVTPPAPVAPSTPGSGPVPPEAGTGPRRAPAAPPAAGGSGPTSALPLAVRVTFTGRRFTSPSRRVPAGVVTITVRNAGRAPLRVVVGLGASRRSAGRTAKASNVRALAVPRGASRAMTVRLGGGERGYVCRVVRRQATVCLDFEALPEDADPAPAATTPPRPDGEPMPDGVPTTPQPVAPGPVEPPAPASPPPPPPAASPQPPPTGRSLFTATCGGCHTLADAGTAGRIGPNLDDKSPGEDKVRRQVLSGGGGMPAFRGILTTEQVDLIARYVASVT